MGRESKVRSKSPSPHTHHWMDVVPDLCFLLDKNGVIIESNKLVRREFGCRVDEVNGHQIWNFLDEGSRDSLQEILRKIKRKRNGHELEIHFHRKDGTTLEALAYLSPYRDGIHSDIAIALVARNISEQKEKELRFLQFSEVIHRTINPIEITDASGKIVYVNPAFEKASGYSRDELIGKNPNILSSGKHPKEFWSKVWDTILSGKVWVGEIENRTKSGEPLHTQLLISPITDKDGKIVGFLGAHRDITEQKRLQEQLVHSQKMESIGTLAAGIAHEVGNPLTSISSLVQVIQRTTKDAFAQEKLELVKNQINRIAGTIRQLVDFSRPSNYEAQLTDVNQLVRESLGMVQYGKKAQDVYFHLNLAPSLPKITVVPDQLIQVFINILMNAVDAMEGKRGDVIITTKKENGYLKVIFEDTGKGIAPDDLGKVFDPFYTTKKPGEGTGLGLWVSYGIMKNFGGDIQVKSELGKGSTFTLILPYVPEEMTS